MEPSAGRMAAIRANQLKHKIKLQNVWLESLRKWLSNPIPRKLSRSRYVPHMEDRKHDEMRRRELEA